MTLPFPVDPPERRKANWLGRYLDVEGKFDSRLKTALVQAHSDIADAFGDLRDDLFSAKVRRTQVAQSGRAVRRIINGLFGTEVDLIRSHQQDAAMAATNAALYEQRGILSNVFNGEELASYTKSLEQSAARNIDAVMTRVLESEKPLSARVYKTQALSQGMVNRAINKTLASGGSAADLAKSVEALIDPATPGGVSYAARRLGRTELNNAFHAQSIHDAQSIPWIDEMEWHLSKRHESDPGDECEEYALLQYFSQDRVPEKPHPNCRCYVTPRVPDRETFVQRVDSGQYDDYLDNWLENDGEIPVKEIAAPIQLQPKTIDTMSLDELNAHMAGNHPGLEFENFDAEHTELGPAREIVRATDEFMAKYPNNGLTGIHIVKLENTVEEAHAHVVDLGNGRTKIEVSQKLALNPAEAESRMQKSYAKGQRVKGVEGQPFYTNMVHEFGHVLDFNGQELAHGAIQETLENVYKREKKVKVVDPQKFSGWLSGRNDKIYKGAAPSRYALSGPLGSISDWEMLAESYQDVELNGKNAKPVSKAMHRLLLRSRISQTETGAYAAGSKKAKRIKGFQVQEPYDEEIKKAETHAQIVEIMTKRYPQLTINYLDRLPLSAAKEVADAIEDNVYYYPKGKLKWIEITDIPEKKNAEGVTRPPDADGNIRMILNVNAIRDPEVYAATVRDNKASGHNRSWSESRPYYSLFTHEFGHTIDFTGNGAARGQVVDVMLGVYDKLVEPEVAGKGNGAWVERAKAWLIANGPSTYGWKDTPVGKVINPLEMLPEAYADTLINQDASQEVSRYLTGILNKAYKDAIGE